MKKTKEAAKTVRRMISVLVSTALFISLAGCQKAPAAGTEEKTAETAAGTTGKNGTAGATGTSGASGTEGSGGDKTYTFGYIAFDMKDLWNSYSAKAFEYAGDKLGVETIIQDPGGDLEKSIAAMEDLIAKKVDGISLYPISIDQAKTLITMANDAGIPITVENMAPDESWGDIISACGNLYYQKGYDFIEWIGKNRPDAKVYYCAGSQGMGITEEYIKGIEDAQETYHVNIVAQEYGNFKAEPAMNVTQNLIQRGQEFDLVIAQNGQMAKGVHNALVEAGMEVPILSTGGSPSDIELLEAGGIHALFSNSVAMQGLQTFKNLYDYCVEGQREFPEYTPNQTIIVTKDEIDQLVPWDDPGKAAQVMGWEEVVGAE